MCGTWTVFMFGTGTGICTYLLKIMMDIIKIDVIYVKTGLIIPNKTKPFSHQQWFFHGDGAHGDGLLQNHDQSHQNRHILLRKFHVYHVSFEWHLQRSLCFYLHLFYIKRQSSNTGKSRPKQSADKVKMIEFIEYFFKKKSYQIHERFRNVFYSNLATYSINLIVLISFLFWIFSLIILHKQ